MADHGGKGRDAVSAAQGRDRQPDAGFPEKGKEHHHDHPQPAVPDPGLHAERGRQNRNGMTDAAATPRPSFRFNTGICLLSPGEGNDRSRELPIRRRIVKEPTP